MIRKIQSGIFICCVILLTLNNNGYSQNDTANIDNLSLKELLNVNVSTVSKTLQDARIAPATVIVVTRDQIKMRGYQSLLDVIIDLPDTKLDDKIYPDSRNSVTIRGTQGQQNFIILLDGIKISSPTNEALPIMENYPINLAEQVEIVYGPASALYGADAVSGIINVITRKIPTSKNIVIEATAAAGIYRYTNSTLYLAKKIKKNSSFVISGQYCYDGQPDYSKVYKDDPAYSLTPYQIGTLNTIYGPITPLKSITPRYEAPTSAYNVYAMLHLNAFTFSFFTNNTKIPTSYSNNTNNAIYNKSAFMGQDLTTGSIGYKKTLNRLVSTTSFTANRYYLNPQSNFRNLFSLLEPVYKYSKSSTFRLEEQLDYKIFDKFTTTGGASFEKYHVIPQSADLDEPANSRLQSSYAGTESFYKPNGLPAKFYSVDYNNIGSYVQVQYAWLRKINFTLGARYDYNSRYGHTFNPRLCLVYNANEQTTIKALYGSAFRSPAPSDAYASYGAFDTQDSGKTYHASFLHLPNPNLEPVRSQNFELSIHRYVSDNFTITLDGYYTILTGLYAPENDNLSSHLYNNMFNGIPVDYIEVFINDEKQYTVGGSILFNLKHTVGNAFFNSYASLSYVNARVEDPDGAGYDRQAAFISPFMVRIGTDVKANKFTFSGRLLLMGTQNLPGTQDTTGKLVRLQTLPGYVLLNVSVHYTFGKHVSMFANVTNALNQHYRSVGYNMNLRKNNTELFYGQREDPIRIMAGLNVSF
ncbi:hypothetical protein CJD36_017740 [Flavipsychrobacter stenotrophus]|uniref:TonB-dependent receptor n=1 Tax=Flavipsychrobacter stenotrophus TaxID=2077091 RepID=A0A2S7SS89_9BACT|nr:TonB-dependent receptor [Flavipsychrobacter stenotrophus]PQJ09770.1 hypothetical protein CJD36_017740 [Flavipsychrobacter stenotrophus]